MNRNENVLGIKSSTLDEAFLGGRRRLRQCQAALNLSQQSYSNLSVVGITSVHLTQFECVFIRG